MRFRVLGPVRVWDGTAWVGVRAAQQRVVLAVLLAEPGRVVGSDRLVEEIWGERPPRAAVKTVQAYVLRLRRLLGGDTAQTPLRTRGHGYELVVGEDELDAARFERLTRSARRALAAGRVDAALALLSEALALWQGPAYADVPPSPTVAARAAQLEEIRLAVVEDRAGALLDTGQHATAVDELRRLVDEHPLRERLWAQLMLGLHRGGGRAQALAVYQRARRVLRAELGLEPGAVLREVQRAVLADEPAAERAGEPAGPPADQPADRPGHDPAGARAPAGTAAGLPPAQLPPDVADFTGRAGVLRLLDERLPAAGGAGARPATVLISAIDGLAGVGKTALGVHWAHRVRDRFPDGQLYLNLRGYAPGPPVPPVEALARLLPALGVPADQVPADAEAAAALYRSRLAGQRVLLLLDDANHADQVRPLLPGTPGCVVLVTSRDRLTGLVARNGAVRLNLDVLTAAESRLVLTRLLGADRVAAEPAAAAELADLCGHLPLALRIAAANLAAHPARSIAAHTARLAGDRLSALQVDGDPQATVRATFELSYAALPADTRRLFRLLGLLRGPDVAAPAAAALAGLPTARAAVLLDRLAAAHLVEETAPGRYASHSLLRLYAAEQAAAAETDADRLAAVTRLLDSYLAHVDAAAHLLYPQILRLPPTRPAGAAAGEPPIRFGGPADALGWLDAERTNLVAAARDAAEYGPRPPGWRLADALRGYLYLRGHAVDWQTVAEAGLAAARAEHDRQAETAAHLSLASLRWTQGRHRPSVDHLTDALAAAHAAGWAVGAAAARGNLGNVCWALGQLAAAVEHYREVLAYAEPAGQPATAATAMSNLAGAYVGLGRLAQAAEQYRRALARHRQVGARSGEVKCRVGLGEALGALGRLDEAVSTLDGALALARELGDRTAEGDALFGLAAAHRDGGRPAEALRYAEAALTLARQAGDGRQEADALLARGGIARLLGQPLSAVDDLRCALELARGAGGRYTETDVLIALAAAYRDAGRPARAQESAADALVLARPGCYRVLEGRALAVLAALDLDRGRPAGAAEKAEQALAVQAETGYRLGQADAHLLLERARRRAG